MRRLFSILQTALVCPSNISIVLYGNDKSTNSSGIVPYLLNNPSVDMDVSCSANSSTEFAMGRTSVTCNASNEDELFDTCDFSVSVICKYFLLVSK